MILFLLEEQLVDDVLEVVYKKGNFDKPGTGIAFVLPVMKVIGLNSQISHFQRMLKRHDTSTGISGHAILKTP